jgi:hypothetical protein
MDWQRVRNLASGVLIIGALVAGGIVGNVLLLGRADHSGDPVGHLSARIARQPAIGRGTLTSAGTTSPRLTVSAPTPTVSDPPRDDGSTGSLDRESVPDD